MIRGWGEEGRRGEEREEMGEESKGKKRWDREREEVRRRERRGEKRWDREYQGQDK